MKKTIFFVATAAPLFALASTEAYRAIITVYENEVDLITGKETVVVSSWRNKGSQYGCSTWLPTIASVNVGVSFEQKQNCNQNQERDIEIYNVTSNGKKIFLEDSTEEQTISVENKQMAIGSMDMIVSQRADPWSIWTDITALYDCDSWTPDPNSQLHGSTFTQNRNCSKDQERVREIFDVWHSGKETKNSDEYDNQTIYVLDSQIQIGLKDYILSTTVNPWGLWVNKNGHYDCDTWTPNVNTIDHGTSFTQTRDCKQDQERIRDVYDNWKVAGSVFNRTETDNQTITEQESQAAIGTKNIVTGTAYGNWSNWSNSGGLYSCGSYSPATSTVNHGTSFTQTGSCKQNQTRSRDVFDVYTDGSQIKTGTENGSQTINVSHSRGATGTKDYIVGTVYGSWSGWSNSGSVHTCSSYSPSTSTVNHGTSFTQTRSCKQNQTRSRTVYNDWKVQSNTYKSTETGSQTINVSQSRGATGTKDYIVGTVYGSWSGWSNSGGAYSCGSYSPATSTVNHGTSFTQTRSCKQNQTRSRTLYNDWKVGSNTYKSTETGSKTINVSQSRGATGTKDYIIGTIYGSWSGWSNDGGKYSCGSYSPATSTVNHGTSFTQTGSCKQNQKRTRTLYNDWKVGSNTYKSTQTGTQTINVSHSRSATGTKNYIVGTVYGSWSGWSVNRNCYKTKLVLNGYWEETYCVNEEKRTRTLYNDWKTGSNTYKSTETAYRDVTGILKSSRPVPGCNPQNPIICQ